MTAASMLRIGRKVGNFRRPLDWAFEQDVGTAVGKMILCVICRLGDGTGRCFASIPKIARLANCQEASVRKYLKEFLKRGWLKEQPSSGHCTRMFVIEPGGCELAASALLKATETPAESVSQNPKNHNLNPPSCMPQEGRQLGPIIPTSATTEESVAAQRAFRLQCEGRGG